MKESRRRIENILYSPDGAYLFAGEDDGSIHIWQVFDGKELLVVKGYSQPVTALEISADGCQLISGSSDRLLKAWRLDWEYEIPENDRLDDGFQSCLECFLAQHRLLDESTLTRSGKPAWSPEDLEKLFRTLETRGYGRVSPAEVNAVLRTLVR